MSPRPFQLNQTTANSLINQLWELSSNGIRPVKTSYLSGAVALYFILLAIDSFNLCHQKKTSYLSCKWVDFPAPWISHTIGVSD